MEILSAEEKDLSEILTLQKLCYVENAVRYNNYSIPPLTQDLASIRKDHKNGTILKAVVGQNIIGSVRAYEKDKTCYIGRLIVHPDHQNKGIGSTLLFAIESRFSTAERYELFTGWKDEKNLHLYKRNGYAVFKEEELNEKTRLVYLEKRK